MLTDEQVERYARQIIVPGIGAAGQQKLLDSTVLVVGEEHGCRQARRYLEAAGVRTIDAGAALCGDAFDVVIACGANSLGQDVDKILGARSIPIAWYALEPDGFVAGIAPGA